MRRLLPQLRRVTACSVLSGLLAMHALACRSAGQIQDPAGGKRGPRGPGPRLVAGRGVDLSLPQGPLVWAKTRARLWKLSDAQYARSVAALFPHASPVSVSTPGAGRHDFILASALHHVGDGIASQYQRNAERVAAEAVGELETLLPCDASEVGEEACAARFIHEFASRAFRRPLGDDEQQGLMRVFAQGQQQSFGHGIELVLQAVLQAPSFLYRSELGTSTQNPAQVLLTPHEIASALSYTFYDSLPDAELRAEADSGALADPAQIATQVRRLLGLTDTQRHLTDVVLRWLDHYRIEQKEKLDTIAPDFATLRYSMLEEARRFVHATLWQRRGSLAELLTSRQSFVDLQLSELYGLDIPKDSVSPTWRAVELPPERAGILTQSALLSTLASPEDTSVIHRGLFVLKRLLCVVLPPPSVGAIPDPVPGTTQRQQANERAQNPVCAGCHDLIDPLGLTFESFDPVGRHRTRLNGKPIDTQGYVGGDLQREVANVAELAQALAESEQVRQCVEASFFEHAFGRASTISDMPMLEHLRWLMRSQNELSALFEQLPNLDEWRYRAVSPGQEP